MRNCAKCKEPFDDELPANKLFITCMFCRRPLPNHGEPDGCHRWGYDGVSSRKGTRKQVEERKIIQILS